MRVIVLSEAGQLKEQDVEACSMSPRLVLNFELNAADVMNGRVGAAVESLPILCP